MIEVKLSSIQTNIEIKLNCIKQSNALYYHKFNSEYVKLKKKYKGSQQIEYYIDELEYLLERIDDTLRGAD